MTKHKGHKTGFNPMGSNDATPNASGAPKTKFGGRGGMPEGPLKHYPGGAGNISDGNRRTAKSDVGDGGGSGTHFNGRTAFSRGRK